jgi:hypothetical protein
MIIQADKRQIKEKLVKTALLVEDTYTSRTPAKKETPKRPVQSSEGSITGLLTCPSRAEYKKSCACSWFDSSLSSSVRSVPIDA